MDTVGRCTTSYLLAGTRYSMHRGEIGDCFFYYFVAMNTLLSPRGVFFGKRSHVFEGVAYSKLSILNILVFKLVTNF